MKVTLALILVTLFNVGPARAAAVQLDKLPANAACQQLWELALAPENGKPERMQTDSYLFFQGGRTRYEHYNAPFNVDRPHCLWSATKSIMVTIAERAIEAGKLRMDDRLDAYFKNATPAQGAITVRDLMQMTSGIEWHETGAETIQEASAPRMLYGPGAQDHTSYVLTLPQEQAPGRKWAYSTGNTMLLSAILGQVLPDKNYPWKSIFDPLRMKHATIERDPVGNYVGSSYGYLRTRDMLKFGQLYLNGGVWGGKRLVSKKWIKEAATLVPAILNPETPAADLIESGIYGTGFWINQPVPSKNVPMPWPNSPADTYMAAGHYGQLIVMIPSRKVIIVRTGHDENYWDKIDSIINLSLKCFK